MMGSSSGSINMQPSNPFKQPFYGSMQSLHASSKTTQDVKIEEEDTIDGMEMTPSEASSQHNPHNLNYINEEIEDMQVRATPPTPQILLSASQFPIKQASSVGSALVSGVSTARHMIGPFILQGGNQNHFQDQSQESSATASNSQLRVLSDLPQQMPASNQPSALVRQLSDKVRGQAERLSNLESYKTLLERRILDFDPKHSFPVSSNHLGLKP